MRSLLHRLRFIDYKPSGIVAVALHPSGAFIAIARENADLELWACDRGGFEVGTASGSSSTLSAATVERGQVPQAWLLLCAIPGTSRIAIRGMVWVDLASPTLAQPTTARPPAELTLGPGVDGCRLLACSLNGAVAEADWPGRQLHVLADSAGGAAWCISAWQLALAVPLLRRPDAAGKDAGGAHPPLPSSGALVAVGCEDGGVRLFRAWAPTADAQLLASNAASSSSSSSGGPGLLSTASGRRAAAGMCELELMATCPGTDGEARLGGLGDSIVVDSHSVACPSPPLSTPPPSHRQAASSPLRCTPRCPCSSLGLPAGPSAAGT